MMVRSSVGGDWFPNSCLAIVPVDKPKADVCGYYEVLGVDPNSPEEDIKAAAKERLMESHPDTGGTPEMFMEVYEAYSVLSDEGERAAYDSKDAISGLVLNVASAKPITFELPTPSGMPGFYKEPADILTEDEISLVYDWIDYILEVAQGLSVSLEVRIGVSKSLSGYRFVDGIFVVPAGRVPERQGALTMILREMSSQ